MMNESLAANVQFCEEYEALFQLCLQALSRWNILRDFYRQYGFMEKPSNGELWRVERNYASAFSALRTHARQCVVCEETLRAHMNGGGASSGASLPS
jgi:hypothetical protein